MKNVITRQVNSHLEKHISKEKVNMSRKSFKIGILFYLFLLYKNSKLLLCHNDEWNETLEETFMIMEKISVQEKLTVGTDNAKLAQVPLHSLANPSCTCLSLVKPLIIID